MTTILVIILPIAISTPLVLIAMNIFPKMFPHSGHYFVTASCLVPFIMSARVAGSFEGWASWLGTGLYYVLMALTLATIAAGLWDTYAKAANGEEED